MAKVFYQYTLDDSSLVFAFLQDAVIGAALGNIGAAVGLPRLPDKLKPRRGSVGSGASPLTYKRAVVGQTGLGRPGRGAAVGGGGAFGPAWGSNKAPRAGPHAPSGR